VANGISLRPLLATRADSSRFVGREVELDRLLANVGAGVNTLVLADRGAGLTSLLNRAVVDLEQRDDLDVVVLSAEVARSAADLLAAIADRISTVTGRKTEPVGVSDRSELASDEGATVLWRLDRIARLAPARQGGSQTGADERQVVVVIDGIGSPAVAHTVFGQLRNELWHMETITWVLGGVAAQRGQYLEPPADAFWESVIELAPLSTDDLDAILVQRDLSGLGDDLRRAVIGAANGNPMQLLLGAGAAQDGRRPNQQPPDARLGESAARLIHYLQTDGPSSASDKGLLAKLGWSRGRAQQVLKVLEDAGLVSAELTPADGGPGRPRKVYRVSEAGR
jgi:hypothetical protein